MQRRRQLESLAAEGGRGFEERRRELEQWLARMENRLDRQPLVGQTLDVLETQLREHRALAFLRQGGESLEHAQCLTIRVVLSDGSRLLAYNAMDHTAGESVLNIRTTAALAHSLKPRPYAEHVRAFMRYSQNVPVPVTVPWHAATQAGLARGALTPIQLSLPNGQPPTRA
ncbi:dystrophin-like [Tropilaelaps mercedesae]|uniref:Dystrophin-like n=1 Tax=Tropilaelaps mercedesae TaxID=418985 RepID=A0A1V9X2Y1_9ACAR|nr:dystrophin-like [Tropilaelaps mercedesae]